MLFCSGQHWDCATLFSANVSSAISVSTKVNVKCPLSIHKDIISNSVRVKWTYSVYMFTLLEGRLCFSAGSRSCKITFTKVYRFFLMRIWKAYRLHNILFLSFLSLSLTFIPHILDFYLILSDCFLFSSPSVWLFQNIFFWFWVGLQLYSHHKLFIVPKVVFPTG